MHHVGVRPERGVGALRWMVWGVIINLFVVYFFDGLSRSSMGWQTNSYLWWGAIRTPRYTAVLGPHKYDTQRYLTGSISDLQDNIFKLGQVAYITPNVCWSVKEKSS